MEINCDQDHQMYQLFISNKLHANHPTLTSDQVMKLFQVHDKFTIPLASSNISAVIRKIKMNKRQGN
jgi:hypothetical protein